MILVSNGTESDDPSESGTTGKSRCYPIDEADDSIDDLFGLLRQQGMTCCRDLGHFDATPQESLHEVRVRWGGVDIEGALDDVDGTIATVPPLRERGPHVRLRM